MYAAKDVCKSLKSFAGNGMNAVKAVALAVIFVWSTLAVVGQGTIYFNAHLTGNTPEAGDGTFSLATNYFTYDVLAPYGYFQGQIRSPWPDTNAAVVFNLFQYGCTAPIIGYPGFCEFRGHFMLTDPQVADLQSDVWYVYLTANPPIFIQGQIVTAPEPSSRAIGLVGFLVVGLYLSTKENKSKLRRNHAANQHRGRSLFESLNIPSRVV